MERNMKTKLILMSVVLFSCAISFAQPITESNYSSLTQRVTLNNQVIIAPNPGLAVQIHRLPSPCVAKALAIVLGTVGLAGVYYTLMTEEICSNNFFNGGLKASSFYVSITALLAAVGLLISH